MSGPFLYDRVKETTTSTLTGTISLAGAVASFRSFVSTVGNGNTCYYAIVGQGTGEWEVGIGTVTAATPDTLTRDTVLASSNSGSLVSFSAGTKDVFCTLPAGLFPAPISGGSILFGGSNGVISQNNSNLFWDGTSNRLGAGTTTPKGRIHGSITSGYVASAYTDPTGNAYVPGYQFESTVSGSTAAAFRGLTSCALLAADPGQNAIGLAGLLGIGSSGGGHTFSSSLTFAGINGQAQWYSSGNSTGVIRAGAFGAQNRNTGTMSDMRGVYSFVQQDTASGSITNAYAFYGSVFQTTGTITNNYGIYIQSLDGTNKYAARWPNNAWVVAKQSASATENKLYRLDATGLNFMQFGTSTYIDDAADGVQTVAVPASGGTGYVVGDILTLTGGATGSSGATVKVTTVSSGAVTGLMVASQGTGYGNSNFTAGFTGGSGSGIGTATATVWGGFNNRANHGLINLVSDRPNYAFFAPALHVQAYASSSSTSNAYGTAAASFEINDRADVTGSPDNKPSMYGVRIICKPSVDRNNVPNDDFNGLLIRNLGTGKGTDCIYVGYSGGEGTWSAGSQTDWNYGILISTKTGTALFGGNGYTLYGLDLNGATCTGAAIRVPNNTYIAARNAADSANVNLLALNASDQISLYNGKLTVNSVGVLGNSHGYGRTTADQAFSNNTTPANVTNHSFSIGANEVWEVEWNVVVTTSGTSAGIKFQVTGPASPTDLNISCDGYTNATARAFSNLTAFSSLSAAFGTTAVTGAPVRITACINNGANSGTVQLQAASNAASNSTCSVLRDSYMAARRIA
jgi:hypothetical protein